MNTLPQRLSLTLADGAIFELPDAHEVDIECRTGALWITLDHDRRDIVLAPGEHFRGDSHRRALIAALESSCVGLSAAGLSVAKARPHPRPARSASPWRLWPHGMSPA